MKKINFYSLLAIILILTACSEPKPSIPYFSSPVPMDSSIVFAPDLISKKGTKEGNGVFTPDGTSFLYIQVGDSNALSIMQMDFVEEQWSMPYSASFSKEGDNWEPFLSHDGSAIYFISNRSTSGKWNGRIFQAKRSGFNWEAPSPIELPVETQKGFWFPSVSTSNELYFGAYLDSLENFGKSDLYRFDLNSSKTIENLGPGINSPHEEWDPFIAKDGSYLLFASDRPGGFGKVDTYISFFKDNAWGKPINLGAGINTSGVDVAAKVTPDEQFILFDRPFDNDQDIFWVSADIIHQLKKNYFNQ